MRNMYYCTADYGIFYGALQWDDLEAWLRENVAPPALVIRTPEGVIVYAPYCSRVPFLGPGSHALLCKDGTLVNACIVCTHPCSGAWSGCVPPSTDKSHRVFYGHVNYDGLFTSPATGARHDVFKLQVENGAPRLGLSVSDSCLYALLDELADSLFYAAMPSEIRMEDYPGPPVLYELPGRWMIAKLRAHRALGWYADALETLIPDYAAIIQLTLQVGMVAAQHILHAFEAPEPPALGQLDLSGVLGALAPIRDTLVPEPIEEYPDPLSLLTRAASSPLLDWKSTVRESAGEHYFVALAALLACDEGFYRILREELVECPGAADALLKIYYLLYHGLHDGTMHVFWSLIDGGGAG